MQPAGDRNPQLKNQCKPDPYFSSTHTQIYRSPRWGGQGEIRSHLSQLLVTKLLLKNIKTSETDVPILFDRGDLKGQNVMWRGYCERGSSGSQRFLVDFPNPFISPPAPQTLKLACLLVCFRTFFFRSLGWYHSYFFEIFCWNLK